MSIGTSTLLPTEADLASVVGDIAAEALSALLGGLAASDHLSPLVGDGQQLLGSQQQKTDGDQDDEDKPFYWIPVHNMESRGHNLYNEAVEIE